MSLLPRDTIPHANEQLHSGAHTAEPKACLEHEAYEEHEKDVQYQKLHETPTPISKWSQDITSPSKAIMALEPKCVGWDGPVWCSRFGRFENQEDAAHDDGYPTDPKSPIFEDRRLHRCEKSTCQSALVPAQHHLYVNDIKRRLEPMTQSLVQLEHQIQHLIRHILKDGQTFSSTGSLHDEAKNGGTIAVHHGELGDPLHEPVEDHNYIGETAITLEPSHFPVIDANPSFVEMVQQPNHISAVVDYSVPLNHGTPQELSHPRHAHYKEGFNQEGPPLESIKEFNGGPQSGVAAL